MLFKLIPERTGILFQTRPGDLRARPCEASESFCGGLGETWEQTGSDPVKLGVDAGNRASLSAISIT